MPRASKKRGKHKSCSLAKNLSDLSHHKICLTTAIDDRDNILFKIAGLGPEDKDKLNKFRNTFQKNLCSFLIQNSALINFAIDNQMISDTIPSITTRKTYKTHMGNSLTDVNQLHQELSTLIRKKHSASTRHLPDYLNWLVFSKKLRYSTDGIRRRSETYITVMKKIITLLTRTISKKEMPIDLYKAYHEYHYGIYAHQLFA